MKVAQNPWDIANPQARGLVDAAIRDQRMLPPEACMEGNLQKRAAHSKTLLHYLAQRGELKLVPRCFLTRETLSQLDSNDCPVMHLAIQAGIEHIPTEVLTSENLKIAAPDGATGFHIAASYHRLDKLPPAALTKQNLLLRDNSGSTVLHTAAGTRILEQVPAEILTEDNLLIPDKEGTTPFHLAAEMQFHLLPRGVFTKRALSVASRQGKKTPLHSAGLHNQLDKIPPELLTEQLLSIEDEWGCTPLQVAAQNDALAPVSIEIVQKHAEDLEGWMTPEYAEVVRARLAVHSLGTAPASIDDLD